MPVAPDAAARAIAQVFGTVHRAGHAGAVQYALTTHLAIKQRPFARLFDPDKDALDCAAPLEPAPEWAQQSRRQVVEHFKPMRMILQPAQHVVASRLLSRDLG